MVQCHDDAQWDGAMTQCDSAISLYRIITLLWCGDWALWTLVERWHDDVKALSHHRVIAPSRSCCDIVTIASRYRSIISHYHVLVPSHYRVKTLLCRSTILLTSRYHWIAIALLVRWCDSLEMAAIGFTIVINMPSLLSFSCIECPGTGTAPSKLLRSNLACPGLFWLASVYHVYLYQK